MWAADDVAVVPIPWWTWVLFVGFTVLGLVEHGLFKTGRFRASLRWYFDERQPFYIRNLPFMLLPGGLVFACWTVMAIISRFQGQLWGDLLVLPIGLLSFVLFGWGIKRQLRPPDRAKPEWLKAEEARRQALPTPETEM
jgi:hypothetical protein